MKAILGYHYATGIWAVIDIMAGPLTSSAETYKKCQVDKSIYTEIVEAPFKNASIEGESFEVELADGYELPDVLTLEQSIANNRKTLSAYVAVSLCLSQSPV